MAKMELIDSCLVRLQLTESKSDGSLTFSGEYAKCTPTQNGRLYRESLWKREFARLAQALSENRVYGHLDHPSSGKTELAQASHVVTSLVMENGLVIGTSKVLGTRAGQDLRALIEAGCTVGVSSRGYGSVVEDENGIKVVQDDFRLLTFDVVAEPADSTAFPKPQFEDKEEKMSKEVLKTEDSEPTAPTVHVTEEEVKARIAKAVEEARLVEREALKEQFAKNLTDQLEKLEGKVKEDVRRDFLADPEVAGAKEALEQIKSALSQFVIPEEANEVLRGKDLEIEELGKTLAEQDLQLKEYESKMEELATITKTLAYRLYVEETLAGDPDATLIRTMIGDVANYETHPELKDKIEAIQGELSKRRLAEEQERVQRKSAEERQRQERSAELLRFENAQHELELKVSKLTEALTLTMEANKELTLRGYIQERLERHPQAASLRPLVESAQSRTQVDTIIEQFREPRQDTEQREALRSKLRNRFGSAITSQPIEEERRVIQEDNSPYKELGVSLSELRSLAKM